MVKIKNLGYLLGGIMAAVSTFVGCQDNCIKWGSQLGGIHQSNNQLNMSKDGLPIILGKASVSESNTSSHVTYCCWSELNPEINLQNQNILNEYISPSKLKTKVTIRYYDENKPNGFGYKFSEYSNNLACLTVWPQDDINVKDVHMGHCDFYMPESPVLEGPVWAPERTDEWEGGYQVISATFSINPRCLLKESEKTYRQCTHVDNYGDCTEWRWE